MQTASNFVQSPVLSLSNLRPVQGARPYIDQLNLYLSQGIPLFEGLDRVLSSPMAQKMQAQSFNTTLIRLKRSIRLTGGYALIMDDTAQAQLSRYFKAMRKAANPGFAGRALDSQQLGTMLAASGKRTAAWILFLCHGVRIGESCSIRLDQVNFVTGEIQLYKTKFRKKRPVWIRQDVLEHCVEIFQGKEYLMETYNNRPYTTGQVTRMIKTSCKQCLGFKLSSHDIRRTFATEMELAHPEMRFATMRQAGWKLTESMDPYVRIPFDPYKIPIPNVERKGFRQWIKTRRTG
jgi:integrase